MKTIFEKTNGIDGINLTDENIDVNFIPSDCLRKNEVGLPQLSELDVMRHYKELSDLNFCIEKGFYPLGSCTMKYNPKVNEFLSSLDGFNIHPNSPDEMAQGSLKLMYNLQNALLKVTGMDAITLQPSAGAHGEMTGMMIIKKYFDTIGEKRTKVIIANIEHIAKLNFIIKTSILANIPKKLYVLCLGSLIIILFFLLSMNFNCCTFSLLSSFSIAASLDLVVAFSSSIVMK